MMKNIQQGKQETNMHTCTAHTKSRQHGGNSLRIHRNWRLENLLAPEWIHKGRRNYRSSWAQQRYAHRKGVNKTRFGLRIFESMTKYPRNKTANKKTSHIMNMFQHIQDDKTSYKPWTREFGSQRRWCILSDSAQCFSSVCMNFERILIQRENEDKTVRIFT